MRSKSGATGGQRDGLMGWASTSSAPDVMDRPWAPNVVAASDASDTSKLAPSIRFFVFLLLASSSYVMVEPAPCDVLFPLVLGLAFLTGHLESPTRVPAGLYVGMGIFALANYASVILAWGWEVRYAWFFMGVSLYMLAYFLFFALFVGKYGSTAVGIVREGYLAAAAITATIGILAQFDILPNNEIFFRDASMVRVKSTFKDPNVFAPFLVGAVFLATAALTHSKKIKLRHVVVAGLSLTGILLSFSRGAYVHFLASLAVYIFAELFLVRLTRPSRRILVGAAFVVPAVLGLFLVMLVATDMDSYFLRRLSFQSYDQERFGGHLYALEVAAQNLFGIGPGQWKYPRFDLGMHNLYLRVLAENGFIGFLSLMAFLGIAMFHSVAGVVRRGPFAGTYAACLAVTSGILVESAVIDTLHWRHFFFFLSIPVGLSIYESRTKSADKGQNALVAVSEIDP